MEKEEQKFILAHIAEPNSVKYSLDNFPKKDNTVGAKCISATLVGQNQNIKLFA